MRNIYAIIYVLILFFFIFNVLFFSKKPLFEKKTLPLKLI